MAEQKIANDLDFEALRRAVENLDAELLASLYADDAEVRVVGHEAPPSSPVILRGREEIAEAYREAYGGQHFIQRVESAVVGEDHLALRVAAEYPDGKRELCGVFLDLDKDAKIARNTTIHVEEE